jgi:hypothetical protein
LKKKGEGSWTAGKRVLMRMQDNHGWAAGPYPQLFNTLGLVRIFQVT